jgi:hypothetical protein
MDRVEEIEAAITQLGPDEYGRLLEWLRAREQKQWDDQIDRDSSSGKLDFLFKEIEDESTQGRLRGWPPQK